MKNIMLRFLFLLTLHFISSILFAQKQFHLQVKLPQGINKEKVEAWLDNGKRVQRLTTTPTKEGVLVLTGDYYSMYAAVTLQYPPDPPIKSFGNTFFLQEKPGVITFHPSAAANTLFASYSLQNVLDFEEEKAQIARYDSVERRRAKDYEDLHGEKIFDGTDTAVQRHYFNVLMKDLKRKRLEYIRTHPESYYSFYSFRADMAGAGILPADSILRLFNAFPEKFIFSDEGNYLNQSIHGRLLSEKKGNAIDFTARDIQKRNVTLSDFKGKKYVLLHFWATWCTPCMKELPAIKEINEQYKQKDVKIISIAVKSNTADYKKAINKHQMDWIHIYDNPELLNKYGNSPIPRIYLIDKSGKVVYDQYGLGENEDYQLRQLKERLSQIIQ